MAELGMPSDAPYFRTAVTYGGGEWAGYRLEMLGMEPPEQVWPPPWPYWALSDDRTGTVFFLKQIWLRRVFCPDSPVVVEARWHPESGESISTQRLEEATSDQHLKSSLKGVRLLRTLDHKGRPPGTTNLTREEFLPLYEQARKECIADGCPPTDNNLLVYLPISKGTLVRYRKKWVPRG
jgi:hypothetical protein